MATKIHTTKAETRRRAKLAKIEAKRSAPINDRQHPIVGTAMLTLLKDMVATHRRLEDAGETTDEHDVDTMRMGAAMAVVPPSTPEEALAAACLLWDDGEASSGGNADAARRVQQRALGLAAWIEVSFGLDRTDYGLDWFCDHKLEQSHLPASPPHPYSWMGAAPLRAGIKAAHDQAAPI